MKSATHKTRADEARFDDAQPDRLPPNSPEAEEGVLGCCLLSPLDCIDDTTEALPELEAFYDLRYRKIFEHLVKLRARGAVDLIMLQQSLKDEGMVDNVGGLALLGRLPDVVPSAANLAYYLGIVRDKWLLRKMLRACANVALEVYEFEGDVQDFLAAAEQRVMQASETRISSSTLKLKDCVADVVTNVLEQYRRGVKFRVGPSLGFNYLDNIIPGLAGGQLIVLAARPRTGKSAFIMQVAEHIALDEKQPVAVVSLEMTARSLTLRNIFQRAGADLTKFLNGFLTDADVEGLVQASHELSRLPIYIDESPRMSIEDFEVKARRMARQFGVKAVFVDYFQLMYVRQAKREWSKSDELAAVSMRLKGIAKELNIPIFVCAQMNRQIEQDVNRRPRLADLRDTGQLEQDADVIMFLWKRSTSSQHFKDQLETRLARVPCPVDWKNTREKNEAGNFWNHYISYVTCTVEKQREGRSGEDSLLAFIKPWTRFVDAYRPKKMTPEELQAAASEPSQDPVEIQEEMPE